MQSSVDVDELGNGEAVHCIRGARVLPPVQFSMSCDAGEAHSGAGLSVWNFQIRPFLLRRPAISPARTRF